MSLLDFGQKDMKKPHVFLSKKFEIDNVKFELILNTTIFIN